MEHSDWWHVKQAAIQYKEAKAAVEAKKQDIAKHVAHQKAGEEQLGHLEAAAAKARLRLLEQVESMKT